MHTMHRKDRNNRTKKGAAQRAAPLPQRTDEITSREPDGGYNEAYCRWCMADGVFVHTDLDELAAFLVQHTPGVTWTQEQAKAFLQTLDHWKTTE